LEGLEDRQLLSTFTVISTTDTGTGSGTSGDLRYCITQAEKTHTAKSDTITFSSKVFAKPITLGSTLTLNDSNPLTIKGPAGGKVTVSGGDAIQVLQISSGTVTISNLAITHGFSPPGGGGIYIDPNDTVTLTNCTFNDDTAQFDSGGGIANGGTLHLTNCTFNHDSAGAGGGLDNFGTATLTNCTLSNNSAGSFGAGINNDKTLTLISCTLNNNSAFNTGGGINNGGTVTLTDCTMSNNSAGGGGGGAIFCVGTFTLTNCTLSNNSTSGQGGGIESNGGTDTLTNCTLSNNSAAKGGGIDVENGGTTLNLTNTLIAQNTAGTGPDLDATVTTADHNLIGNGTGSAGITNGMDGNKVGGLSSIPVIDPRLGPLQNNGGLTQTLALLADSPAIGAADNSAAIIHLLNNKDQRGVVRQHTSGESIDIGAYET